MTTDPTDTAVLAALLELADAMRTAENPEATAEAVDKARREIPKLRAAVDVARELDADPDPPEPAPPELLPDLGAVSAALDAPDAAAWLTARARELGPVATDAEALRRVLRYGHREEPAPAPLAEAAGRELERRERGARRMERSATLAADPRPRADEAAGDVVERVKDARTAAREARGALAEARTMREVVTGAQHAEPVTDWTGDPPPPRAWLLAGGWLAAGRVHLLTGKGGRGKSRLALQVAAALAADGDEWPLPWRAQDARAVPVRGAGVVDHPPTLPQTAARGVPVVVASWEDERDEVHRRLLAGHVAVDRLGDRLHYVDVATWGPLWAPAAGGSGHVQTLAELTGAGRRLRRLCERRGARLLIVDPLAAAYGSDENVRGMVRQFVTSWDAWGRATDCAVLLIAHPPKAIAAGRGDDDWWSGSTDWQAAVRGALVIRHEDAKPAELAKNGKRATPAQSARTWLQCMKGNYGPAPEPVDLLADGVKWWAARGSAAEAKANGTADKSNPYA